MGPNHVLDKGFLVDSAATNVEFGRWCKFTAAGTGDVVTTSGAPAAPAVAADLVVGVYQETLDAAKVSTGKATVGVRVMGISRMIAGAAVPKGTPVTSDAQGRAIPVPAGTNNRWSPGVAWTAAANAGDVIDVFLTHGAVSNGGVT
jgi:hypothetical protein